MEQWIIDWFNKGQIKYILVRDSNELNLDLYITDKEKRNVFNFVLYDFLFSPKCEFAPAFCALISIKQNTIGYTQEYLEMFKSNMAISQDVLKYLGQFK